MLKPVDHFLPSSGGVRKDIGPPGSTAVRVFLQWEELGTETTLFGKAI